MGEYILAVGVTKYRNAVFGRDCGFKRKRRRARFSSQLLGSISNRASVFCASLPAKIKYFLVLVALAQLVLPIPVFAHSLASKPGLPAAATGTVSGTFAAKQEAPLNLNLLSTQASVSAAMLALTRVLTIKVGSGTQAVNANSMLTPAELVAAYQVMTTGAQTLKVGSQGSATGGGMLLTSNFAQSIGNLVIPQGVKLFDNVGLTPSLNISGELTDNGKFIAYSTSPQSNTGTINASDIYIGSGALFTSSTQAMANAVSTLHLSLNALNQIVNAGTVNSSGNLSLSAASVTNVSGSQMIAQGSLNICTTSITNAGLISSRAGNVVIANTNTAGPLTIAGAGGTFEALNGQLNVTSVSGINLTGGTYTAQSLNLTSLNQVVNASADSFNGPLSISGGSVFVNSQGALDLVSLNATGDPILEDSSGANVQVGLISAAGEPLTVLAAGTIEVNDPITASSVNLISGVTFANNGSIASVTGVSSYTSGITVDSGNSITSTGNVIMVAASSSGGSNGIVAQSPAAPISAGDNANLFMVTPGNITVGNLVASPGAQIALYCAKIDVSNLSGLQYTWGGTSGGPGGNSIGSLPTAGDGTAGNITQLSGATIVGPTITLQSGTGTIGTAGSPLNMQVSTLTATSGGIVNIVNTGSVTLYGASKGQSTGSSAAFTLTTMPDRSGNGAISIPKGATIEADAGAVVLTTNSGTSDTGSAGISFGDGASITATSITLNINSTGNGKGGITQSTAGQTTIIADGAGATVSLVENGNANGAGITGIGIGNSVVGDPVVLTATSANGSVSVNGAGSVTLYNASSACGTCTFSITTTADSDGNGQIQVGDSTTGATVTAGTIQLTSTLTGSGTGGITQGSASVAFPLIAGTITLADSSTLVTPGPLMRDIIVGVTSGQTATATVLNVNTLGSVTITAQGDVTLSGANTAGSAAIANKTFSLDVTAVDAGGNGAIAINAGATVTASQINLTADSSGTGAGGINQSGSLTTPALSGATIVLEDAGTSTGTAADDINAGLQGFGSAQIDLTVQTAQGSVDIDAIGFAYVMGQSYAGSTAITQQSFQLATIADAKGNGPIVIEYGSTITSGSTAYPGTISLSSTSNNPSSTVLGAGGIIGADYLSTTQLIAGQITLTDTGTGTGSSFVTGTGPEDISIGIASNAANGTAATSQAVKFTANTGLGNVVMQSVGSVTMEGASSAPNSNGVTFTLSTNVDNNGNGAILMDTGATIAVDPQAGTINLTSSSSATGLGGISQNDALTTATLKGSTIGLIDLGGSSTAGAANISVGVTSGATGSLVSFSAVTYLGSVNIVGTGGVRLIGPSSAGLVGTTAQNFTLSTEVDSGGNAPIVMGYSATVTCMGTITLTSTSSATGFGGIQQLGLLTAAALNAPIISLADTGSGSGSGLVAGPCDIQVGIGSGTLGQAVSLTVVSNNGNVQLSSLGSVTMTGASSAGLSANGASFAVQVIPDASGDGQILMSAGATISANAILLGAASGAGGTGGIVQVQALPNQVGGVATLIANVVTLIAQGTSGTPVVDNSISVGTKAINASALLLQNSAAGGILQVINTGALQVGNLQAGSQGNNGSIDIENTTGSFTVLANSVITASGNVSLEAGDTTVSGSSMQLGANVKLNASTPTTGDGNVYIGIGAEPVNSTAGVTPRNVSVVASGGGRTFFNTGLTAALPTNTITVSSKNVVFSTGGLPTSALSLSGGDQINALKNQLLFSLDLTDPLVVAQIQAQQSAGVYGGHLVVSGDVAVGGNLILNPLLVGQSLLAENIPAGVTLTLNGFTSGNVLNLLFTGSSSSSGIVVNGVQQFSGINTNATIQVASIVPGGPLMEEGTSGAITSTGNLTFNLNSPWPLLTGQSYTSIGGSISGNAVTFNLAAGGQVTQISGSIKGTKLAFNGTSANGLGPEFSNLQLNSSSFSVNMAGGSFSAVNSVAAVVTASNVTAGSFSLTDVASITTSQLTASNVTLVAANNGAIVLGGAVGDGTGTVALQTLGTGLITNSTGTFVLAAATYNLNTVNGSIGTSTSGLRTGGNNATPTFNMNTAGANTNAYIANNTTSAAQLNDISVGSTLQFKSTSSILVYGNVAGGKLANLQETSQSGNITVETGGTLGTSTSAVSMSIVNGNMSSPGTLIASSLTLVTQDGLIGSMGAMNISAPILSVNGQNGFVDLNDITSTSTTVTSALMGTTGTFWLKAGGPLLVKGAITGQSVDLTTTNAGSNITLSANVGSAVSSAAVQIQTSGNGSLIQTAGSIITGELIFLLGGDGSFGTAAAPLKTQITTLSQLNAGAESVAIANSGNLEIDALSSVGAAQVTNSGTLTVKPNADIQTNSGAITLRSTGAFTLGAGCTVQATSGSVTLSSVGAMLVDAGDTVETTTGSVMVASTGSSLTVAPGSTAMTTIETTSGSVTLSAKSGPLTLGGDDMVQTQSGNITINETSTTSASISIGAGAIILANGNGPNGTSGNVAIAIGALPVSGTNGSNPSPSTISPTITGTGVIFYGKNGISAATCCNNLAANSASIIFSTGSLPASAIVLGGNDTPGNPLLVGATNIGYWEVSDDKDEAVVDTGDLADDSQ